MSPPVLSTFCVRRSFVLLTSVSENSSVTLKKKQKKTHKREVWALLNPSAHPYSMHRHAPACACSCSSPDPRSSILTLGIFGRISGPQEVVPLSSLFLCGAQSSKSLHHILPVTTSALFILKTCSSFKNKSSYSHTHLTRFLTNDFCINYMNETFILLLYSSDSRILN